MGPKNEGMMVLNNPLELPPGFQSRIITFLVGNPINLHFAIGILGGGVDM